MSISFFYPHTPYNKRISFKVDFWCLFFLPSFEHPHSIMSLFSLACIAFIVFITSPLAAQGCNVTCYIDNDADGQGNCTTSTLDQCDCAILYPSTWVSNCMDCNDADSNKLNITCYLDSDKDNYGNTSVSITICATNPFQCRNVAPTGTWTGLPNDCDDHNPRVTGPQYLCCKDEDCDGVGTGTLHPSCQPCNMLPYSASRLCYDCDDHNPQYISTDCCKNSGNGLGYADTIMHSCTDCPSVLGYVNNCQMCNITGTPLVSCCVDATGDGKGSALSAVPSCHQCTNLPFGPWVQDCSDHRDCSEYIPPTTAASGPVHSGASTFEWTIWFMVSYVGLVVYASV